MTIQQKWPGRLAASQTKSMLAMCISDIKKYLEQFSVADFTVDKREIYSFQNYLTSLETEGVKSPGLYFDHSRCILSVIASMPVVALETLVKDLYVKYAKDTKAQGAEDFCESQERWAFPSQKDIVEPNSDTPRQNASDETSVHVDKTEIPKSNEVTKIEELALKDFYMFQKGDFIKWVEQAKGVEIELNPTTQSVCIKGPDSTSTSEAALELMKESLNFAEKDLKLHYNELQMSLLKNEEAVARINERFVTLAAKAYLLLTDEDVTLIVRKGECMDKLLKAVGTECECQVSKIGEESISIFKSQKGKQFLETLAENSGSKILMNEVEKTLTIVSQYVETLRIQTDIENYLAINKVVTKVVPFSFGKQTFVTRYFPKEKDEIFAFMKNHQVSVQEEVEKFVIKGVEDAVCEAEKNLLELSKRVALQDFELKFFGVEEFFNEKDGKRLVKAIEEEKKCIILSKAAVLSAEAKNGQSSYGKPIRKGGTSSITPIAQVAVQNCSIVVMQGEITQVNVDALVNPIDSSGKSESAMSKSIFSQGGQSIQGELNKSFLQNRDECIFVTSAGQLTSVKTILHLICPVYNTPSSDLKDVIAQCLMFADGNGIKTIGIPVLGVGRKYQFPTMLACRNLLEAIDDHLNSHETNLKKICICDMNAEILEELVGRLETMFDEQDVKTIGTLKSADAPSSGKPTSPRGSDSPSKHKRHTSPPPRPPPPPTSRPKDFKQIKVQAVKGEITKSKTDVIVVGVDKSLDLTKGMLAKAVLKYGGEALQKELSDNYADGISLGDFAETDSGNLECQKLFYGCLGHYKKAGDEKYVGKLVTKMLKRADELNLSSMSIPALGSGKLAYPTDSLAHAIMDAISHFAKNNPKSSIKKINLVLYPKDLNVIQAFQAVMSGGGVRPGPSDSDGERAARSHSPEGASSSMLSKAWSYVSGFVGKRDKTKLTLGSVKVSIKKGDLAESDCDAIVNGIRNTMDLQSGAVGKALLVKCGNALASECLSKQTEMEQEGVAVTSAPGLQCNHIYHVSMNKYSKNWGKGVSKVLKTAEENGLQSIAFPALGAGSKSADWGRVKESILGAINAFGNGGKRTLRKVEIIVFSDELLQAFVNDEASSGSPQHHSKDHHKSLPTPSKVSKSIELKIYAQSAYQMNDIQKFIISEFGSCFKEEVYRNKEIKKLSKEQLEEVINTGLQNRVVVSINHTGEVNMKSFHQSGVTNVHKVLNQFLVSAVKSYHESVQKSIQTTIQWQYEKNDKWISFDRLINIDIERAYKKKEKKYKFTDSSNRSYLIDFKTNEETLLDSNGKPSRSTYKVKRIDHTQGVVSLPKSWTPMPGNVAFKVVDLTANTPEYNTVEQKFKTGGVNAPIKKIQRIQNKTLYQKYAIQKAELDQRNPQGHQNEKELFHGTAPASIQSINENGFNRSYCGVNGVAYGDGVYFATTSQYSSGYARPDAQSNRFMYVAKVLTGVSIATSSGTKVLPPKPGTVTPYDSGGNNSSIYVIFHDCGAYPEYLITF